ncbi:AAA family ATPase, partial [candidate division KSB1 bacterium]|nr:AAA family ATPase [candidate division KSB1 bacterium]
MNIDKLKLSSDKLRYFCDPDQFKFETTAELSPLKEVIGQERAVQAIEFGVNMKSYGYNIYVLGPGGAGRTSIIKEAIERQAKKLPTPDDWCYVYNFQSPDEPNAICLPPGKAKLLRTKMKNLVYELEKLIPETLHSEDFQKERNQIIQNFQEKQNKAFLEIDKQAKENGLALQKNPQGFFLVPVKNGKAISPEEYEQLPAKEKMRLDETGKSLKAELNRTLNEIRREEQKVNQSIEELERSAVKFAVGHLLDDIREDFKQYPEIPEYLDAVESDLLSNIDEFKQSNDNGNNLRSMRQSGGSYLDRLQVNIIIDNSKTKGAPVIVETNPTYNNLIGRIERESHLGALVTDFTMIKGGAFHRANGGFLIVEAEQIFRKPFGWEALKRTLKNRAINITDLSEEYSFVSTKTLQPEPIPLGIKIVLIGSPDIYYTLYNMDDEFRELFKVKADFNLHMKLTKRNIQKYAQFISSRCKEENLLHFNREAVARIVEYGTELVSDQTKLSTRFSEVCNLVREANYWASQENHQTITRQDVQKALDMKIFRLNKVEGLIRDRILADSIFINVSGNKVGEINGLVVYNYGDYVFGKPSRISVRLYQGKSGVMAIDREVKMSGRIHDKGLLILTAFLNGAFGQRRQLSMSASITFEQSYGEIDGDSASSTELYAILSSLSGYPINQGIAVTGSVNQFGEIQPIGGVTQKVEGYYEICKARRFTGDQGVIIPKPNIKNLTLKDEILNAITEEKFHIYAVSRIDEGIEILTGVPAGKMKKDGTYPKDTVYGKVEKKLDEFDEQSKDKNKGKANRKRRSSR